MTEEESARTAFTLTHALDHAWEWFSLHAKQRMDLINFFLVATAFLAAGYASGLQAKVPIVSAAVCVLGVVITICFQRVEQRTRELIRLGEAALHEIEAMMAEQLGLTCITLVQRADKKSNRFTSYGVALRVLHVATLFFFLLGFAYAVWLERN